MTKDEALKLALETLEDLMYWDNGKPEFHEASKKIIAIKEVLAQPEPVIDKSAAVRIATALGWEPKRTWVGLTDEEKDAARWRFLVDNSFDKEGVTQFHVWEHSWEPHSQTGEPTEWKQRVRGPALDRFINRAIEAAHGIKE